MARIIESVCSKRRIIQLSVNDIVSIVQEYQTIVPRHSSYESIRDLLSEKVIYVPEEI